MAGGARTMAAVGALVAPLLAAVALLTTTGTVGLVQRNQPELMISALGVVVVAGVVWLIASLVEHRVKLLKSIAVTSSGLGFILALIATVQTARSEARPQITASVPADRQSLKVRVTASNMETSDRLAIAVEPLRRGETSLVSVRAPLLYNAFLGPDSDGKVKHQVSVALPAKRRFTHLSIRAFTDQQSNYCDDAAAENLTGSALPGEGKPVKRPKKQSGTACITLSLRTPPVDMAAKPRPQRRGKRRPRS